MLKNQESLAAWLKETGELGSLDEDDLTEE